MSSQDTIARNLAAVEAHFHSEAINEVEQSLDLYTDDVVWEAPARNLIFRGKDAVATNYRGIFGSMENIEFKSLDRFATEDRVTDDSIVSFTLTRDGYLPFSVGQKVEMRLVHIFEMQDGKISKEIAFEMPRAVA